ncbi:MAG: hypothetical protein H3C68_04480 [Deltaproteobacteria bacterium]|nr:hypothetical protein [Deltaproteobacteria bacterium]MBZ0219982.1 hypothetical protein [Deltaproteobacteria bacterium]
MKDKIIKIEKGKEGVVLPAEYLRFLELIPGAEVEILLDREKKEIIVRPLHGEDFVEHFKDTMESMA